MNNESDIPTPVTNVETSELKASSYTDVVEGLVADSTHFNQTQLMHYINSSLIESIVGDAQSGALTTKRMNETTGDSEVVTLGVDDVMEQFELALQAQDMMPDNPKVWGNYISRSNGLRDAAKVVMGNKLLAEPFRLAVYKRQADLLSEKSSDIENLKVSTAELQQMREKASEDLGDEAVEASGIAEPVLGEASDAARRLLFDTPANAEVKAKDRLDYLRTALPPVTRPSVAPRPYAFGQYQAPTKEETAQKYYDMYVTEENKQASLELMTEVAKSTPALLDVFEKAGIEATSMNAVDAIREDSEVRFEVAKIFLNKVNALAEEPGSDMGWRVVDNSPNNLKSDPVTGKKFYSREYAVSVALKMLGGEFSEKKADNDFERDQNGKVVSGQHRHAATQALMSYRS
jgi:hypothetical protein